MKVVKEKDGYYVVDENGNKKSGPYKTEYEAKVVANPPSKGFT